MAGAVRKGVVRAALAVALAVSALPPAMASEKLYDMRIFLGVAPESRATSPAATPAPGTVTPPLRPAWTAPPLPSYVAQRPTTPRDDEGSFLSGLFSEFLLGVWRHDPGRTNVESNTWDVNAEIIFRKVQFFEVENRVGNFFLGPRPLIGASLNSENETNTIYTALNWRYIFDSDIFIAGSFGLAYHTGNLKRPTRQCPPTENCNLPGNKAYYDKVKRVTLGSSILFRESLALGYRFLPHHSISFYGAHISNGGILADDNDGMNFIGIRYGYSLE